MMDDRIGTAGELNSNSYKNKRLIDHAQSKPSNFRKGAFERSA